ncbi:YafY family protein [Solwaraspora sp. WMMD1047]|uniref:helix-turn-helix transcriptional regulator n=1 Tax=Solwaraspora sp. WMMD1047 TaxID=3016102 RepID=UPI0024179272|nr:YafY family protein [Solwaraspora sp. WMMD1047]MDG4830349.1 YafY family protein [Solwaraspora sp. WMMD1047]
MLELLQSHHRLTGADLGARLGVDERTVRRYAGTLADLGIPVVAARGRYGGYRLAPRYRLPPLMLTDDEAAAVVLGLVAADRIGLGTEAPATASALAKIRRVLPAALAERLAGVQESLGFTTRARPATARPATGTLLTLGAASRDRSRVSLSYRSWRGEVSLRELDPYGLVFHAGRWYVTGHDHRRAEVRTFRLDRISSVEVLPTGFTVPAGFDPVGHVTRSLAAVPYRWEVEVLLETDPAQARRRIPATVAELTESADGVLMRTRAQDLTGMAQLLAGLGWPFTILRPEELRTAVTGYAARFAGYAEARPAGGA